MGLERFIPLFNPDAGCTCSPPRVNYDAPGNSVKRGLAGRRLPYLPLPIYNPAARPYSGLGYGFYGLFATIPSFRPFQRQTRISHEDRHQL